MHKEVHSIERSKGRDLALSNTILKLILLTENSVKEEVKQQTIFIVIAITLELFGVVIQSVVCWKVLGKTKRLMFNTWLLLLKENRRAITGASKKKTVVKQRMQAMREKESESRQEK